MFIDARDAVGARAVYEDVTFGCEAFAVGYDDWRLSITCTAL